MDEDKIVGLIEKLYIEMQNMKSDMQNMRSDMHEGFEKARLDRTRIEHTLMQKIDIVADGVVQNANGLDRMEVRVANTEELIKERSIIVSKDHYVKLLKKAENK